MTYMDITEIVIRNEPMLRLGCFLGVFIAIAVWEILLPRRPLTVSRWIRWSNNLAVAAFNAVLARVLLPAAVVGYADVVNLRDWGLLNQVIWPSWIEIIIAILVLDFAIYLQHIFFHVVPALWRVHRMHHADLNFDVTTGSRFHPIEIMLSLGIKFGLVTILGPAVIAVFIFEVLLSTSSIFNHGNIKIARSVDYVLRWFFVTPDMHRVHHSIAVDEINSNYGFNLTWWDRLLGTYRAHPAAGHEGMIIGVERFRTLRDLRLDRMLMQPWRRLAECSKIDQEKINR